MAAQISDDKAFSTQLELNDITTQAGHLANQEDHEETVRQALTRHPWAVLWCVYAIWVVVISSFDNQVGGVVISIPEFRKDFGSPFDGDYVLPAKWQSAYSGGPVASAVIGSFGSGYLADRFGRKLALLLAFVFVFAGITAETVATTNPVFFAGKFINGFAVGGFTTLCFTYIGEIAPLALRGIMIAAGAIAFTLGPFMVALIVNYQGDQPNRWAYRGIFVAQYAISSIGVVLLPFMPESPWWLLSREKDAKAVRALRRLGQNPDEIEKRVANIKLTLEEIRKETEGVSYLECFRKSNLRRTMIAIAPLSICALCGVFFVASYSTYYIQLAGYSTAESFKIAIAAQVCSMVGNIGSWFIIDRVGRRNISVWGVGFLTVLLCLIGGLATTNAPGPIKGVVGLLLVYNFFYNLSIGATSYTAAAEIATSRLRAKTVAIGIALQNGLFTMWAFVIPYLFNPDQANLGAKTAFIFGGLGIFCTIYLYFCHPEVAGRSYEELDEMFMKKVSARNFKTYQTGAERAGQIVSEQLRRGSK